jgi:L-cysteine desulfidase
MVTRNTYQEYLQILQKELIPALGCTEPISIAYASSKARELLGEFPDHVLVECSGNVIKNVMGVVVPNTGNLRGVDTSAILGIVAGIAEKKLEVLSSVTPEDLKRTKELLDKRICKVKILEKSDGLHLRVTVFKGKKSAMVEIANGHTNIVRMEINGMTVFQKEEEAFCEDTERSGLNIAGILKFAESVKIQDVQDLLDKQCEYNKRIAEEGLANNYGADVGKMLLTNYGNDVKVLARAYPAAGVDARMNGCSLPVIINSGSGNQGLTVSLPVLIYGEQLGVSKEKLYRALVLSNLTAIHIKTGIGKLSAFCGAVSAACGCGAGIAYLYGGGYEMIAKTITNTLANIAGMICDGAKSSCAAKVASAVEAAVFAFYLARENKTFGAREGLVKDDVEETIRSFCTMAREGMYSTDQKILSLMLN